MTDSIAQPWHLPALSSAHSHAFQRAMRGQAQQGQPQTENDDFWSWREAMYRLAASLDPQQMHAIARVAYREMHRCGIRTVGEFHYLHHQPNGQPYDDPNEMSEVLIEAARAEGLRIALLRVVYARAGHDQAGHDQPPAGAQRRFCDADLDTAFRAIETLASRYAAADDVRIGIAPHSVRAVPPTWLRPMADFATQHSMPLHMHVAEQPAEVAACLAETGRRPVELLAEHGVLGPRFVAVHATHLLDSEAELLGQHHAYVCICPSTERDLGDGLPNVSALLQAGVRLCLGIDSHVLTAPLEEMRSLEWGERLRRGKRIINLVKPLWQIGSIHGARACGFDDAGGVIAVDPQAPELALVAAEDRLAALVFSGSNGVFKKSDAKNKDARMPV